MNISNLKASKLLAIFMVAVIASQTIMPVAFVSAKKDDDIVKKVWVCKYVGTPGVDERLKTGNDGLVEVSINTIKNFEDGDDINDLIGQYFVDQQGRSFVVKISTGKKSKPAITECPGYEDGDEDEDEVISNPEATQVEVCGPNNDTITLPEGNFTVSASEWVENKMAIVYTAKKGFTFEAGKTYTENLTDKNEACPITDPDPDDDGEPGKGDGTPVVVKPAPKSVTTVLPKTGNDAATTIMVVASSSLGLFSLVNTVIRKRLSL